MKRIAFLIGGSYASLEKPLAGVALDVQAWKDYLSSPCGGCWAPDEIVDLSGKDRKQILLTLITEVADYALVCFSGHGYLTQDRFGFDVTMAKINDMEAMSERELNPGSPWCMQIFDCCRKSIVESAESGFVIEKTASFSDYFSTRKKFDRELLRCEKGLVKVFATGVGRSAADKKSFSRVLLETAKETIGNCQDGVLRINDAVRLANAELPSQQTPVYMGGRRLRHFPFAVSLKAVNL